MEYIKTIDNFINESYHDFKGVMLKDIKLGGKSNRYPFSDTPEVRLKKGQEVTLIIQDNLYQFLDYNTGKKLGSIWMDDMDGDIKDLVDYK